MIRTLFLVSIVSASSMLAFHLPGQEPDRVGGADRGDANGLLEYVGYYQLQGRHPLVVSYRPVPGRQPVLLVTDLKTDAVRGLFPSGKDQFRFGPELVTPEPAAGELQFLRSDSGVVVELEMSRGDLGRVAGPRLPIRTEPVRFERDGVSLEGTLFLPPGKSTARSPGILFAHGSEEEGQRYHFDSLPWLLAQHGFVALAYDKRGTGASTGSWQVGLDVLARDAVVALGILRRHSRVDPTRLGIMGTSEGAWLAPLIARIDGDVDFIVAESGGGMTKGDTFLQKYRRRFVERGLAGADLEEAMAQKEAIVAAGRRRARQGNGNGFDLRISYDPGEDWRLFEGSVLVLMGDADVLQDTQACAQWLRNTLARSKSTDWQIKVFPRTHHSMFLAHTGGTLEFQRLRMSHKAPGYWSTLLYWLDNRY